MSVIFFPLRRIRARARKNSEKKKYIADTYAKVAYKLRHAESRFLCTGVCSEEEEEKVYRKFDDICTRAFFFFFLEALPLLFANRNIFNFRRLQTATAHTHDEVMVMVVVEFRGRIFEFYK